MTMAYLDLAGHFGTASPQPLLAPDPAAREAVADFSPLEWQVVRIARQDRLSSLREESEFKQFLRIVFGFERTRPLANPGLEALRRIAVLSWHHGYNVDNADIAEFLTAGYSLDQYDAMLAHIGRERAASTARRTRR